MNESRIVEVEISDRVFNVEVTEWTCKGDYYTPDAGGYEVESDIYDENGNDVTDLIRRYERIYKIDFDSIARENFNN